MTTGGDPLAKVLPGDPLRVKAATWNRMLDATRAEERRAMRQQGGGVPSATDAATVLVRNDESSPLDRFAVVQLGAVVVEPADNEADFLANPVIGATVPTETGKAYAVLQEPLGSGKIGLAKVSGVVPVRLLVEDAAHGFAEVEPGETARLVSAATGSARIVYREADSGECWALVQLPFLPAEGGGEPFVRIGKFRDAPGVTGAFPQYPVGKVIGRMLVPRVHTMAPIVPATLAEWLEHGIEYGIPDTDVSQASFAIDASQTGETLDLYCIVHAPSNGYSLKQLVGTMQRTDDTAGTQNYYWKGGVRYQPGSSEDDDIRIATGYESHAVTAVDQGIPAFYVGADLTAALSTGTVFTIVGGPNEGTYTADAIAWDGAQTEVVTQEPIPDPGVSGELRIGGTLLINGDEVLLNDLGYGSALTDAQVYVERDVAANGWVYFPRSDWSYHISQGDDPAHPVLMELRLPEDYERKSMLLEKIPAATIPYGCHTVEAAGDGTEQIRIRYRHHTTGDLYEILISCTDTYWYSTNPLDYAIDHYLEYGTRVLEIFANFDPAPGAYAKKVQWYGVPALT